MRTLYAWANERPEFEEAVEAGWHPFHAHYARLVRQNLTNPTLRQNVLLQVMAKRFPSTWGQTLTNTLDNFLARNTLAPNATASPETASHDAKQPKTRQEILGRIKVIMDRMAERNGDDLHALGFYRLDQNGEPDM